MPRLFQLLIVFSVSAISAAADLGALQKSFIARYDEANATRDENLGKLETSYLGALKRHMDKVKASGKLERVIPVRDEIEAVETGAEPLPELPENADRELKGFRDKYVEARTKVLKLHAETLTDLAGKMDEALEREEAELTKAGKIDEALAAKRMRETLSKDAGIAAAREAIEVGRIASQAPGKWRDLLKEPYQVVEKGLWEPSVLGEDPAGRKVFLPLAESLRRDKVRNGEALLSHAPAKVRFEFEEHVRGLKAEGRLLGGGRVALRVKVDGKQVFEEELKGRGKTKIELEFPPARTISLEVDSLGDSNQDWAAWIEPRVR